MRFDNYFLRFTIKGKYNLHILKKKMASPAFSIGAMYNLRRITTKYYKKFINIQCCVVLNTGKFCVATDTYHGN